MANGQMQSKIHAERREEVDIIPESVSCKTRHHLVGAKDAIKNEDKSGEHEFGARVDVTRHLGASRAEKLQ